MTAIGYVTKNDNGSYKGQLKTVSIRADIDIIPNRDKSAETHPDFRGEELEWFGAPEGCFAFRRTGTTMVCALNTSSEVVPLPPGEVLLASGPLPDGMLPPDTAAWLA